MRFGNFFLCKKKATQFGLPLDISHLSDLDCFVVAPGNYAKGLQINNYQILNQFFRIGLLFDG